MALSVIRFVILKNYIMTMKGSIRTFGIALGLSLTLFQGLQAQAEEGGGVPYQAGVVQCG